MAPTTFKYAFSALAYTKIILHAAKYPHAPVNGVLLGSKSSESSSVIEVTDTIPLLHSWTSLSPMMEIGLDLARSHADERQLKLVGYYQATERPDDSERVLYPVGEKVAASLLPDFEGAFALVVDGTTLGSDKGTLIATTLMSDVPLFRKDVLHKIPVLKSYYIDTTPASDKPF